MDIQQKLEKTYIKKLISHIGFMTWEVLFKYDEKYHTEETRWGGRILNQCHFVYAYYICTVMGWEEPEYYQNDEEISNGFFDKETLKLENDKNAYIKNVLDNLPRAFNSLDVFKADPLNGQFISHDEEKEKDHIAMMEYFLENLKLGPSPDKVVSDKPTRDEIKSLIKVIDNIKQSVALLSLSMPFGIDKKRIREIESLKFPLFFAWGAYHYGDRRALVPQEFGYQMAYEAFTLNLEKSLKHNITYLQTDRFMNSYSMKSSSSRILETLFKIQRDLETNTIGNL